MNQPNVLVITDDPEFPRLLLARWSQERIIPTFTISTSDALNGPSAPECDLAVVGRVRGGRLAPALKSLDASARPTVCIADTDACEALRQSFPRAVVVRHVNEWADSVVLIAIEALRRIEALNRGRRLEQTASKLSQEATLGRYMIEVRHGLNNALTSVLGNAELLLCEAEQFTPEIREQIETIQVMSLKMHEMLYRFSSLHQELQFSEKQSQSETDAWGKSAAAGA